MQKETVELTIIIPAYNEKNIKKDTLLKRKVVKNLGIPFEIIIVSGDDKYKKDLDELASLDVEVLYLDKNRGKGYAIFHGLKEAKGHYVLYIDADNDIDPSIIKDLYTKINREGWDMVYANKYHKFSRVNRSFIRNLSSRLINLFIHLLFNIDVKDTQTGAKIYKREILEKIDKLRKAKIPGFAFEVEIAILLKKLDAKVNDIPVQIRVSDVSSVATSNVVSFFKDLLILRRVYGKE